LRDTNLPHEIKKGRYMLAIYKVTTSRIVFGKEVTTESLYPILYDVDGHEILTDHELAEKFMGRTAIEGQYASLDSEFRLDEETIDGLRYDLKDCISDYVDQYRKSLDVNLKNNQMMRYQQTEQYYNLRVESFKAYIRTTESNLDYHTSYTHDEDAIKKLKQTLRLQKSNLNSLIEKKREDLGKISEDAQLKVIEEIKSLNLIKVV
jgi:hypothetical protein